MSNRELTAEDVFARLDPIIEELRYTKHSFVQRVTAGPIAKHLVREWAMQKYWQVFHQIRAFSAIHSRSIPEDVRAFEMENLIAEETGYTSGSESHYRLMMRFACALGTTEEEVLNNPPHEEVMRYCNFVIDLCRDNHYLVGLTAYYALEAQIPDGVIKMHKAFQEQYGLSDEAMEWFPVHAEDDVEHSLGRRRMIAKYFHEMPDYLPVAEKTIRDAMGAWRRLHDFYYEIITREDGEDQRLTA